MAIILALSLCWTSTHISPSFSGPVIPAPFIQGSCCLSISKAFRFILPRIGINQPIPYSNTCLPNIYYIVTISLGRTSIKGDMYVFIEAWPSGLWLRQQCWYMWLMNISTSVKCISICVCVGGGCMYARLPRSSVIDHHPAEWVSPAELNKNRMLSE